MGDLGSGGAFKLSELGTVARGRSRHRPRNDPSLYGGPYPFFQTGDVKAADLYLRDYSQTYNEKGLAQSKLWQPGTLCITIAANIAETAILGIPGCFPDSIVGFVADPEKADTRYIKYHIDTIKLNMQNASKGTTQDNLSVDKLLTFDFHVPPVAEQRQIADTLSAYDELIENNTRRIAILEEMAQRLYREWFVHFRYPGHESVPLVDSEFGPIPEGWNVVPLSSIADLSTSQTSPAKFGEELVQHFSLPAFDEGRLPVVERGDEIKSNKFLVEQSCVLLAKLNPKIPRCWLVYLKEARPALASTEFLVLTPKHEVPLEYLSLAVTSDTFWSRLEGMALGTSTSHQRVKPADAMASLLVLPPVAVIQQFENRVAPLLHLHSTLITQMKLLRELQSLLLPRMIS